ncbi:MAG TPA: hypothetical protein GX745_00975 [Clostridiales bacterium]|nr:hypothetical protein [Clostridiales bacterium]
MIKIFAIKERKTIKQSYKLLKALKCQYCSFEPNSRSCKKYCLELLMQIKMRERYIDDIEREDAEMAEQ